MSFVRRPLSETVNTVRDLTPDDLDVLTARYLAGEMSQAEMGDFLRQLESNPEAKRSMDRATMAWRGAADSESYDVDAAWMKLSGRLHESGTNGHIVPLVSRKWRYNVPLLRYAAALLVSVGLISFWRAGRTDQAPTIAVASAPGLSYQTSIGERREVTLADGSTVLLGAQSSLRLLGDYGSSAREVELIGEALFTVRHDEARPFRVRTNGALVEDLGTVFSVRAIGAGTPVEVAVSEGSVALARTSADSSILLAPRDRAVVGDTGEIEVMRNIDVAPYYAWSTGRLAYRDTRFELVIADLERWYDVEFQISDTTLLRRLISADYDTSLPIDQLLDVVGATLDSRLVRRGRIVEIALPDRASLRSDRAFAGSGA